VELFYDDTTDNPWKEDLCGFNHGSLLVDDIHSIVEKIKKEERVVTSVSPPDEIATFPGLYYTRTGWFRNALSEPQP
jgi:hypothetical protein